MKLDDSFDVLATRQAAPAPRVLQRLQRELRAQPSTPTGNLGRRARLVWSAACLFAGFTFTTLGMRAAAWFYLPALAVLFSLVAVGLVFPRVLPGSAVRLGLGSRRVLIGGLSVGLLVGLTSAAHSFVHWDEALSGTLLLRTFGCLLHATATGALIAAGLLVIWRRTDPFTPGWTGALFGAVGGLLGAASVSFVCVSSEGWHMTIGHGLGALLLVGLGALAGSRWLRP